MQSRSLRLAAITLSPPLPRDVPRCQVYDKFVLFYNYRIQDTAFVHFRFTNKRYSVTQERKKIYLKATNNNGNNNTAKK